jgi:hypothetical protein
MSARVRALALLLTLAAAAPAGAQTRQKAGQKAGQKARRASHFFDSEEPLALTLTTNIDRVRGDRGTAPPRRAATLTYAGPDGTPVSVPLAIHTRGIWRLKSCQFPPLRLDFEKKTSRGTVFEGIGKPKLVSYCRDSDAYEQYVLQEMQLYRVQALVTPESHRVRLVRVTYADSATGAPRTTRYAFIMEDPAAMAARFGGSLFMEKGAKSDDFDPYSAARVGVFEYMIGNADWSASQLHNVEIIRDSAFAFVLVPYDYDFSGAVNARYATPDPHLELRSVRDRVYVGHCATSADFAKAFALFAAKKDAIYALYSDPIGRLLKPEIVKETLAYFDDFYRTIGSPADARREIVEACGARG